MAGGPLVVEGVPIGRLVKDEPAADGSPRWSLEPLEQVDALCALCRCGRSTTKPFCDRRPDRRCFEEPAHSAPTPVFTWSPPEGVDGSLVALKPNGPVRVSGRVRIEREDGTLIDDGDRVSLCRCGHSAAMPFCDGSHKVVGFRDA